MQRAHVNGVELVYEIHGTGDPLVLIHGAQSDRSIFANLLPDFVDHFQVLLFDQRGSGQSEKPDIEYTMGMLADDTAALMDHVGFSSAHVYGVSMGGMIAQELAIRHGAAVRSLILGCTTPGGPQSVSLEGEAIQSSHSTAVLSAEERSRALAETAFTQGYVAQRPEIISALIEARKKQPLDPIGFAHRMKAAYRHNTFDRLSHIRCPTLVITGKNDALIAWENSQLLADHIADAELMVLEPAGHVFWMEQPAQARDAIVTFLQQHESEGATMSNREITKNSQARMIRSWMLGLHATHITDIGGRLGYFAELRRRGGTVSAEALAETLELDPWRTKVWCQAAGAVGILQADGDTQFAFAPFMDALLGDEAPELLTAHVLASLARDFPAYPDAFRTGTLKTFHDHDEDFFRHQGKVSALRPPVVVAAARKLPGMEERLGAGGRVMDIGSGSGTVLVRFAEEFENCQVTGLEPLPYFAEASRKLIQAKGLGDRVDVRSVGGEALSLEPECDLITMVQVFHELPDTKKIDILRGCQRSLKPGGILLMVDRCAPETGADLHDRRFTMSILEQWFEVTWGNIVNTRSEILAMLNDTGFTVTQENPDIVPTYWTFVAEKQG